MKRSKIIVSIGCLLLLLTVGLACYRTVMKLGENGYGYRIHEGERTIIVQPFIPVIAGKKPFRAEQDARRVGNLVLERIKAGDEFAVSKADLDNLKIVY